VLDAIGGIDDKVNRRIVDGVLAGLTQEKIALELGIRQQAVSSRIKKLAKMVVK
jgi:hypothetical protein